MTELRQKLENFMNAAPSQTCPADSVLRELLPAIVERIEISATVAQRHGEILVLPEFVPMTTELRDLVISHPDIREDIVRVVSSCIKAAKAALR